MGKIKNSPLIEAIFEFRWGEVHPNNFSYSSDETELFPGIFSQAIKKKGFIELERPNTEVGRPNLPYVPKYRFRKAKNQWPCFQIGLGIFTANQVGNASLNAAQSDEYDWDTFKPTIELGLEALDSSHPLHIENMLNPQTILRYQDALPFEESESIESFIKEKVKADIHISNVFTDGKHINKNASDVNLNLSYQTSRPTGIINIAIVNAQLDGKRVMVIDTSVISKVDKSQRSLKHLMTWCEEAHDLQRHAFETLIQTND